MCARVREPVAVIMPRGRERRVRVPGAVIMPRWREREGDGEPVIMAREREVQAVIMPVERLREIGGCAVSVPSGVEGRTVCERDKVVVSVPRERG